MPANVNDRDAAEAVLEHKSTPDWCSIPWFTFRNTSRSQGVIRVLTAMYRKSEHWITNTARGGKGDLCPITPEIKELCLKATKAVGNGVLAVDLVEHPQKRLVVNESNHTMEFQTMRPVSGIDIAGKIVDYVVNVTREKNR